MLCAAIQTAESQKLYINHMTNKAFKIQVKICEWVDLQRREILVTYRPPGCPESYKTFEEAAIVRDNLVPDGQIIEVQS